MRRYLKLLGLSTRFPTKRIKKKKKEEKAIKKLYERRKKPSKKICPMSFLSFFFVKFDKSNSKKTFEDWQIRLSNRKYPINPGTFSRNRKRGDRIFREIPSFLPFLVATKLLFNFQMTAEEGVALSLSLSLEVITVSFWNNDLISKRGKGVERSETILKRTISITRCWKHRWWKNGFRSSFRIHNFVKRNIFSTATASIDFPSNCSLSVWTEFRIWMKLFSDRLLFFYEGNNVWKKRKENFSG